MPNREKTLGFLFLRVLKWTGLSILGLIVLLVISGLVFQFIGSRIDTGKYPAPGRQTSRRNSGPHAHRNEPREHVREDARSPRGNEEDEMASGHFIQADKPEVIVKSVLGLLDQLK